MRIQLLMVFAMLVLLEVRVDSQTKGAAQYTSKGGATYQTYSYGRDGITSYTQWRVKELQSSALEGNNTIGAYFIGFTTGYYLAGKVMQNRLIERGYGQSSWEVILTEWLMYADEVPVSHAIQMWDYWLKKNVQVRMVDVLYGHITVETGTSDEEIKRWYEDRQRKGR